MSVMSLPGTSETAPALGARLDEVLARPERGLDSLMTDLQHLAEQSFSGDPVSYARYQGILYDLHTDMDPATEPLRRTVTSRLYEVEERHIGRVPLHGALTQGALKERVEGDIAELTRVRHPMSQYLFDGTPSEAEIRSFLHHHWIRSSRFYQLVAELAGRFEDINDAAVFYRNLYEEVGEQDVTQAHPVMLQRLIAYVGLASDFRVRSTMPTEQAYLNNRIRCMRHPHIAWGLGLLYAIERVTSTSHRKIYELLRRNGVPDEYCEFHRIHGVTDDSHADEIWEVIERHSPPLDFQQILLTSIAHHFTVNRIYFDALWQQMQPMHDGAEGRHPGGEA